MSNGNQLSVLISPGQGTHIKNMWSLAEAHPQVREAYEIADQAIIDVYGRGKIDGKNISEWAQGDHVNEISVNTKIAQPLLVASSIGLNEVLAEREHFTTSYGNSLGELSALCAAGAMTKEHAIKLAVIRGVCSYNASQKTPGSMVVAKNAHEYITNLNLGKKHGLSRAIHFSPDSITLAGTEAAIKHAYETLRERYKAALERTKDMSKEEKMQLPNAIMLKIPGGFHSFLMKKAEKEFRSGFNEVEIISPQSMLWFSGHTGTYEGDPKVIQEHLIRQLSHEVDLWSHIGRLIVLGHTRFVESGTAPHISDEYRLQQTRGNLRKDVDFIFGLDELTKVAA
jgi:malonyl CoA-acyl carrier protein transacylase